MATSGVCTALDQPCGQRGKENFLVLEGAGGLQWELRHEAGMEGSHTCHTSPCKPCQPMANAVRYIYLNQII